MTMENSNNLEERKLVFVIQALIVLSVLRETKIWLSVDL